MITKTPPFGIVPLQCVLLVLCGIMTVLPVHAQYKLKADGITDTYELIESVLGSGTTSEVPDCSHPAFGPHITQSWDAQLGKYVFSFFIHVTPDNDRCMVFDRERNEIKTYGPSPAYLKGSYGDTCTYRWKFKLDSGFQPSPNFTHLHQIKAGDGSDSDMPLITITPRAASPERLEIIYTAPTASGGDSTKLTTADLANFKGEWIEAYERVLNATNGTYELVLKRVSDDVILLSCTNTNLNMWRGDATFNRPKWGIYRSLLNPNYLRDEEVRFADFCLAKGNDGCPVDPSLAITGQPESQMLTIGQDAAFSVSAFGTPPLGYQWFFNTNTPLTDATNASFVLPDVSLDSSGGYSVVVTNSAGSVTSLVAVLTVTASPVAPWIITQPRSQTASPGDNVTFSANAMGTSPINYQWQFNGMNLDGATASTLFLPHAQATNQGNYSVVVSNVAGTTNSSNAALILRDLTGALNATNLAWTTAGDAPWYPQTAVTRDGRAAAQSGALLDYQQSVLQTVIYGPGTLVFWWKVSSQTNCDFLQFTANGVEQAAISGEVGWQQKTIYLSDGIQTLQWVYAKNGWGSSGQDAGWLDAVSFREGPTPATITSSLVDQEVAAGSDVTLKITAVGTPLLVYQWQLNGTDIPGATGPSLVLPNVQDVNSGSYGVVITNGYGSNSTVAMLTVDPAGPVIRVPPAGQLVVTRGSASFTMAASGSDPLAYQWQFNGTDIVGETNVTLLLDNIQITNAGGYRMAVSNAYSTTYSSVATLAVGPAVPIAWGDYSYGQTNVPLTLTNVTAVAAGAYHSLALMAGGTVAAWGYNKYGETSVPAQATSVIAVAAGTYHNLALRTNGTVVAWGYNGYGSTTVPTSATNAIAVAAGGFHSLALRADGTVIAWGYNKYGQTDVPASVTNAIAVAAGAYHSLALRADSTVVAWGYNDAGETNVPAAATNVIAIVAGGYHCLALRADGTVAAWGNYGYGPVEVPPQATNIAVIAAGLYQSLAIQADGTVLTWGYNLSDQMNVPARTTNAVAVAAGWYHSLSIANDGSPFMVMPPAKQTVLRSNAANFRVTVLGTLPLAYQWQCNGTNVAAATGGSLTLTNVQPEQAGDYRVIVTNVWGSLTSRVARLTVLSAPWITVPPPAQLLAGEGSNVTLTATAGGTPPLSYQWQFNGTNIAGATNSSLVLTNVQTNNVGSYSLVVSNNFGTVSSGILLSVSTMRFVASSGGLQMTSNGCQLRVDGLAGHGLVILYASTNLLDWDPVSTNPAAVGTVLFLDAAWRTNYPARFYRVLEQ